MRRLMLCLIAVISISGSVLDEAVTVAMLSQKKDSKDEMIRNEPKMKAMTPMEALDLVKDRYATNFEKGTKLTILGCYPVYYCRCDFC